MYFGYIVAALSCILYWKFESNYRAVRSELEMRVGQHYHNKFIDIPNGVKSYPMYSVIIIAFCILTWKQAIIWVAAMMVVNMVSNILADRVMVNYYRHRYLLEIVRHSVSFWLTLGLFITVLSGLVRI